MNTTKGMYSFRPTLEQYGYKKKVFIPLSYIFIFVCLVTPCTNWLIPLVKKFKLGCVYFVIERN